MKTLVSTIILAVIFGSVNIARADNWECSTATGLDGEAKCFVSHVRLFTGQSAYVMAKIHDPNNVTACEYVKFSLGTGSSGPQSIETVAGSQTALLTALTTNMPIKFWRLTGYDSGTTCAGGTVIISKPGAR